MPRYRVSYEVEADDSDGAFDTAPEWVQMGPGGGVTVTLLDEPEPEDDCEGGDMKNHPKRCVYRFADGSRCTVSRFKPGLYCMHHARK